MSEGARGHQLGRYLLGSRISTGGMGEIYLATQHGPGAFAKPLALKLLLPHLASEPRAVEMFMSEARVAARMAHPNVVQIFDVGQDAHRYFLAMELVRGVALSTLINRLRTPPPAEVVLYVARALLDGLTHVHGLAQNGVPLRLVHRDVTPHNVLVSVHGEVKLTDFGIAKAADQAPNTEAGTFRGKLGYAAPEVCRGDGAEQRSDLFSAAVSLFHFATLVAPFRRGTGPETMLASISAPLPDLRALRPDLPDAFADALQRAAAKPLEERFATAAEFRAALPAPASMEAVGALGRLVAEACGSEVSSLDDRTQELSLPSHTESSTSPSAVRRVWPYSLGLGLALATGTYVLVHSNDAVEPPPEPVALVDARSREAVAPAARVIPAAVAPAEAPAPAREDPAEPAAAAPAVEPAHPVRRAKARPAEVAGGFLRVDADPWALVTVNGKALGQTPLAKAAVPSGALTVVLRNPTTGHQIRHQVQVAPGQTVTIPRVDLR
ncbi:MAG: serine/threonine protein kinase [Myxococcaceae bacterium]|nr:serine/threonine protein kinase [Myxococcaceae bacterium]